MTKNAVIAALGPPDTTGADGNNEYLVYGYDSPVDGRFGWAETYLVNLVNGNVASYGLSGNGSPNNRFSGLPQLLRNGEADNASTNETILKNIEEHDRNQESDLTTDQFQAWTRDNAYAAEQKLWAKGTVKIRGRVDRVSAKDITLVAEETEAFTKIVCQFPQLPRAYGQPLSYATPAEASDIQQNDLVWVSARFEKYLFPSKSAALFKDCRIIDHLFILPTQEVRAATDAPQIGSVAQAPSSVSQDSPPAGYYQCYRLTAAISANTCRVGNLQLDGQGNYSSTSGPGGTYVFDPAAGVVSFSGGMLNGRLARAKLSNKGTYMLRMRPDGNGLPSPRQTFGTYTFEYKQSGHRERW